MARGSFRRYFSVFLSMMMAAGTTVSAVHAEEQEETQTEEAAEITAEETETPALTGEEYSISVYCEDVIGEYDEPTGSTIETAESAEEGETVYIYVYPGEGARLYTNDGPGIYAYNEQTGEELELTEEDENEYSFVMPDSDVTVKALFTYVNFRLTLGLSAAIERAYFHVQDPYQEGEELRVAPGSVVFVFADMEEGYNIEIARLFGYDEYGNELVQDLEEDDISRQGNSFEATFTMPDWDTEVQLYASRYYNIFCEGGIDGGEIYADKGQAFAGETVQLSYDFRDDLYTDICWNVTYTDDSGDEYPVEVSDDNTFRMPEGDVMVRASFINAWRNLQEDINYAEDGETIVLEENCTAAEGETSLIIPEGKEVTIDLNGYTLDRGLDTVGEPDGSVIVVYGKLILEDSRGGGRITGGNALKVDDNTDDDLYRTSGCGGGVKVMEGAKFEMRGGTITENTATEEGGGVYVFKGDFELIGGEISNNTADYGGGISSKEGVVRLPGGVICENTAYSYGGGVYLLESESHIYSDPYIDGSEGSVLKGNSAGNGGGIAMYDSDLEFHDGEITNNTADERGGAVDIINGGRIVLSGGEITFNSAGGSSGGGIVFEGDEFSISGNPVFSGNTCEENGQLEDVWLGGYKTISFSDRLDENVKMIVNTEIQPEYPGDWVPLTDGFSEETASLENFVPVSEEFCVRLSDTGEVAVDRYAAVRFFPGDEGAGGSMENVYLMPGTEYELPGCDFTPPENKTFIGWDFNGDIVPAGEPVTIEEDTDLTAVWLSSWEELRQRIDTIPSGETIVLTEDVTAAQGDESFVLYSGHDVRIDLNGHQINGNDQCTVFILKGGSLVISDESGTDSGIITGGSGPEGGGIIVDHEGYLELRGGTITGNYAVQRGGGIEVIGNSRVMMFGGTITGNKIGENRITGGGVYVEEDSVFQFCGGVIKENFDGNGDPSNLYLQGLGHTVILSAVLPEGSLAGISVGDGEDTLYEGIVTSGMNGSGTIDNFFSDREEFCLAVNDSGEAELLRIPEDAPEFKGHQLVLSGTLGMRFGIVLPEGFNTEGSYMTFMLSGEEQRVDTADAPTESGRKIFTCYLNTLQMAEEIQAVFHYGGGQEISQSYSVTKYLEYFEEHPNDYSYSTLCLIKAIADYGYYAQAYLVPLHHLEGRYAEMNMHYTDSFDYEAIKPEVAQYTFAKGISDSAVSAASYKLSLDADTALSVFMKVPAGTELTASAAFGGNTYTAERQSDTVYIIKIPGIKASQLGDTITVEGYAEGDFAIKVSALSYVRSVLNNDSYGEDAKNTVSALYKYYEAVKAYNDNAAIIY